MTVAHNPGQLVVVRTVTSGQIRWASAAVVVRDDADWIAFYATNTSTNKVTSAAAMRGVSRRERELGLRKELLHHHFQLVDKRPDLPVASLTIARPGDWFSVRLRRSGSGWVAQYVNVCTPFVRTPIGFDTDDLCLDLVLEPREGGGFDVSFKDADDLVERAALGIYSDADLSQIHSAGEAAARLAVAGARPFDDSWRAWAPDTHWATPDQLPTYWAEHLPHQ